MQYDMTRADFINKFKNNISIGEKNYVAQADAAIVKVFFNSHFVNNTLNIECLFLCLVL